MSTVQGLTSLEAGKRHIADGPNEAVPSRLESRLSQLKRLFLDPMGLMLLGLGGLYTALGDQFDAIVLFLAFIPVTAVDVILDLKASRSLRALKQTLKATTKVVRDNAVQEIPTREIVCGDVILLDEGQSVPADGIFIEAQDIKLNESALTGESVPVAKIVGQPFYGGTVVLQGRGLGTIEHIGKGTRFGKIATLLEETKSVKSPLQIKVNQLVKRVFLVALSLAVLLFFLEYFRTNLFVQSLIVALTFGMAAVPEEFPLVFTLYLSLGAWRLSKAGVLVKSLPSVETLGSVDVICTDKTGTLTEGNFQLEELLGIDLTLAQDQLWLFALMACEENPVDSMEIAIIEKSRRFNASTLGWTLKWDYLFERQGKHMSHVWERTNPNRTIISMKGAVEGVLEHCSMAAQIQDELLRQVDALASQGKRLLGLAYRDGACVGNRTNDEKGLTFIGLLVFSDPIRTSAKEAIAACQLANIQIKMLTGDHPLTAHSVADQTGITHEHNQLYTGDQLTLMPKEQRWEAYRRGVIFSRVLPEQKYEMVEALQQAGQVVAMTGDGINDAPALKLADIGISMGENATDVARSSAQIILLKNDFNGIVEAVFEGRRIFSNLKRSFSYLISFHFPVILLALAPPALGWGNLFLPIHIVLLELVVHPVSAFAFENLSERENTRKKGLLSLCRFLESSLSGIILSIECLVLFRIYLINSQIDSARTIALAAILFGNIAFVFVESRPFFTSRVLITTLSLATLTCVLNWIPKAAQLLHLGRLPATSMALALGVGLLASAPTFLLRRRSL